MLTRTLLLSLVALATSYPVSAQDATLGKSVFKQCQACHVVGPGAKNMVGPQLNGLAERNAGSAGSYGYSQAFKTKVATDSPWDNDALDHFLRAPMEYMPGTKMAFPGVRDDDERTAVIAWLNNIGVNGELIDAEAIPVAAIEPVADSKGIQEADLTLPEDQPIPEHGQLHLGRVALDEEIDAWDIDVRPDGTGLPDGSGAVTHGVEIYDSQCATCHGDFGEGKGRWPMLAGGFDTLQNERPEKTIGSYWPYLSTVFDYVRRAMPFGHSRTMSDNDVYAVTAYLMYLNDLVDEDFTLSAENFQSIRLPNEANFIADTRSEEPYYAPETEPCMANCMEEPAKVSMRALVLDVTPSGEGDEEVSGAGAVD